jgi:hypothetical protein
MILIYNSRGKYKKKKKQSWYIKNINVKLYC